MANEYKMVLRGLVPSVSETRNIFYWRFSVAPTTADFDELHDLICAKFKELCHSSFHYEASDWYQWVALDWQFMESINVSVTGNIAGERMPMQVAIVIIGKTATKRTMGRKFIGPTSEACLSDGAIAAGSTAAALDAASAAYTSHTLASGTQAVPMTWSKLKGFHDVVATHVDSLAGTMRRRKPGVGI